MHIHILGICGTFMGSLAILARQLGHQVSGSDQNVYPPMSEQLQEQGIELRQGYEAAHFADDPELILIGNACSRGNPAIEAVLAEGRPYCSGPEWLAREVLADRWVLAVAGTHGKTTTSSMLAWILHAAGLRPGYLIGGVPKDFPCSAELGEAPFFVIEADEYDSAFFDARAKFIHYRARTAIMGNLEFDHADIFPDLAAIQRQFHHLVKTIPANGLIISPQGDANLAQVFREGVWSEQQFFSLDDRKQADWQARLHDERGSRFTVRFGKREAEVCWPLLGRHNVANAVAAMAAAAHAGVPLEQSGEALSRFTGVKRRLELLEEIGDIRIYDDFAHHPTAIRATLEGMRAKLGAEVKGKHDAAMKEGLGAGRLIAVIEARSNTMKMGYHQNALASALDAADLVVWHKSAGTKLDLEALGESSKAEFHSFADTGGIVDFLAARAGPGDHIVIMSNGGFEGIHDRLRKALTLSRQ